MARILLGTSGWSYDEWVGPLYLRKGENKLLRYASVFDTVEINSSFYSIPTERMILSIMRHVPSDFIFTAKVHQEITHRRLLDISGEGREIMERFLKIMRPLQKAGMLGCLLLQLPPKLQYSPKRLEMFAGYFSSDWRFAVEFRHDSWLVDEAFRLLRRLEMGYVVADEPHIPTMLEASTDFAYFRWHGRGARPWYNYLYKRRELERFAEDVEKVASRVERVYGYFNNHFHGYAVYNCAQVLEMLGLADGRVIDVRRRAETYLGERGLIEGGGGRLT
ncbi:MAG: DUF72 domain-containing protein [Nitrososphaerota archaeon]